MRNIALSLALFVANGLFMNTPGANAATSSCHLPDGWSQVEQRQPRYVIFGELHGTAQSPAFVEDVACALATSGKSVLVGVELFAINDPKFQDAWGKPHDQFADELRKAGWAGRQDGVASEAMFSMLVDLHALKAKGARIAIVAFSGTKNAEQGRKFATLPGQGPHDAAMAENIADASHAQTYDLTLVLVGNIHARLQPVSFAGASFHPMAMKLAETGTLVSLDMKNTGGTAWNCQLRDGFKPEAGKPVRNEDIACVSRPVSADPDPQPDQSIVLKRSADGTYDGAFWLGHIDGSPPAVPAG